MSGMQQVSIGAKEELCDYLKKAKTHFTENTIASAESITVMDSYLEDWYKFHLPTAFDPSLSISLHSVFSYKHCIYCSLGRANDSKKLWETTERGIKNLNTKYQQELNVTME